MKEIVEALQSVVSNVEKVIVGKTEQIRLLLCGWLAGGHVLLEDLPGTGKTMLARALARSVQADFRRVQFTPDLLPTDLLGTSIYRQQTGQFEFRPGPVFTTVLLADEINRATPRTQSALLEAMAESQVTVEGRTTELNPLFFVMATQNPIEHQGTFPLPEAQLDRFMLKLALGPPARAEEIRVVRGQNASHPIHSLQPVVPAETLQRIRATLPQVTVSNEVMDYAMDIVTKTRATPELRFGVSTRGMLALIRASQAMALIEGRAYVSPSQLYHLAKPVLGHRMIAAGEARLRGVTVDQIMTRILSELRVPVGKA